MKGANPKSRCMARPAIATAVSLLIIVSGTAAPASSERQVGVAPVVIPFELATRHIILKVSVNGSRPLSFVLDTGASAALIRMDPAKELGLLLEGTVKTG